MGYRASGKASIITFGKILKDEKIFSRMMVTANRSGGEVGQERGESISNRGILLNKGSKMCQVQLSCLILCVNLKGP